MSPAQLISSSAPSVSNKRKLPTGENESNERRRHKHEENPYLIHEFQYNHQHSIRISASSVAAYAGFHPWKNLPELILMDLVYQGHFGQLLLERDAALLGIQLVSDDIQLQDLALKSRSKDVLELVKQAIDVKNGKSVLQTIQNTNHVKDSLQKTIQTTVLSDSERRLLVRSVKHAVDTGYGSAHEHDALDLYEKQIGCTVYERNAEIRYWPFGLCPRDPDTSVTIVNTPVVTPLLPCAVPCPNSVRRVRKQESDFENNISPTTFDETVSSFKTSIDPNEGKCVESRSAINSGNANDSGTGSALNYASIPTSDAPSIQESNDNSGGLVLSAADNIFLKKPFFCIVGSIDGIRDEITFESSSGFNGMDREADEFENLLLKQVIVECKHRMNRIQSTPPLYEQIQCLVYCLMYNVHDADLIQVLRTNPPLKVDRSVADQSVVKKARITNVQDDKERVDDGIQDRTNHFPVLTVDSLEATIKVDDDISIVVSTSTLSETLLPVAKDNKTVLKNDQTMHSDLKVSLNENTAMQPVPSSTKEGCSTEKSESKVEIFVSRVSLDDPVYQHRQNWSDIILPRLASIVQAAYNIRSNDDKRYRLLTAVASSSASGDAETEKIAYSILFEECPWLESCDTAYHNSGPTW